MKFKKWITKKLGLTGQKQVASDIRKFKFPSEDIGEIKRDIRDEYGCEGDLLDLYAKRNGLITHKWHHYIPLYERYFSKFRGGEVKFLEIGVSKGGSLRMWRDYFGERATIFGIDIDPECEVHNGDAAQVRIGSQDDAQFLETVIREMGGVDIVLDDGSHQMKHIRKTLECIFPKMNTGGVYMVEDLCTSYWPDYGGGYHSRGNFFNYVRELVDDMHHWYHEKGRRHSGITRHCAGIHIHSSIAVFEKNLVCPPVHSLVE